MCDVKCGLFRDFHGEKYLDFHLSAYITINFKRSTINSQLKLS